MLLELHQPFVVLDSAASWKGYEVVVLPDGLVLTKAMEAKARKFLAAGGCIVAAGSAGLREDGKGLCLPIGAKVGARANTGPDYLMATEESPELPVRSAIVIGGGAYRLEAGSRARVLATRREPYFARSWERFCSHQHAPDSPHTAGAAAVVDGQVVYFAHDLFTQYRECGQPLYRDFFVSALRRLLSKGLPVETNLPTVARLNLLRQPAAYRHVVHLSFAPISLRAQMMIWGERKPLEIVEDEIPLRDVQIAIRLRRRVRSVRLVPRGKTLPFSQIDDVVRFMVPEFTTHQMVELAHGSRAFVSG